MADIENKELSELEQLKQLLAKQEAKQKKQEAKQKEQEARIEELLAKLEAKEAASAEAPADEEAELAKAEAERAKAEAAERRRYAAWLEEKVPVKLIKLPFSGYSDSVFLSINGESIRIKRGEPVEVKRKFAMLLDQSQMQNNQAIDFMDAEETRYLSDVNTRA